MALKAVHLLIPGNWTISRGHRLADEVEKRVLQALPHTNIVTHLEPSGDPASLEDAQLDRQQVA